MNGQQEQQRPAWYYDPATERQIAYLTKLVEDRVVPQEWIDKIDAIIADPPMTKGKAGEVIAALKKLPLKGPQNRAKDQPDAGDVPAGRYAIQYGKDPRNLGFYRVWRHAKNPKAVQVYQQFGPNEEKLPWARAKTVLKAIYRAGAGEAAIRYGRELGRCSKCGLPLTNRISRELGIGPVCGGRFFKGWRDRVTAARAKIREDGYDPYERVED